MLKFVLSLGLLFSFIVSPFIAPLIVDAAVSVKGYYRKDGTYVKPHYRSNPDGNPYNNYSYPGNTNPYTGKVAPGNTSTYLKNYGSSGSSNSSSGSTGASLWISPQSYTPVLPSPSVSLQAPKYKVLTAAPKWVEYVGQHDTCAQHYDRYSQNLTKLKSQYSPAPLQKLYADTSEYAAAATSYNYNNARLDREIDALWADADYQAWRCYEDAKAPVASTTQVAVASSAPVQATSRGVTLAELIELFIAVDVIPAEKAAQARTILEQAPQR